MLRSAAVLAGLVFNATLVGLLNAGLLFKEGREAIEQGKVCSGSTGPPGSSVIRVSSNPLTADC